MHADEDWDKLDWSRAPAAQETPITSAILSPVEDEPVRPDGRTIKVQGYAFSGGGRAVIRVDVSADNGKTWKAAELLPEGADQGYKRHWAWRHWQVRLHPDFSRLGTCLCASGFVLYMVSCTDCV
jgi:sulfite oxidase